jgi:hypothetical protein
MGGCVRGPGVVVELGASALGKGRGGHGGEAEGVVRLAVGEQAGVGGDPGPVELELEVAAERDP